MPEGEKNVIQNRKAFHDYAFDERFEAGLVLHGTEVKALREGRGQIRDAYVSVRDGEAWLLGMHISPYSAQSTHVHVDPMRERKLLLKKGEIEKLAARTQERGLTVVPLRLYFTRGIAKLELGVGRGKKSYDRRRAIATKDAKRDIERARRSFERGS